MRSTAAPVTVGRGCVVTVVGFCEQSNARGQQPEREQRERPVWLGGTAKFDVRACRPQPRYSSDRHHNVADLRVCHSLAVLVRSQRPAHFLGQSCSGRFAQRSDGASRWGGSEMS